MHTVDENILHKFSLRPSTKTATANGTGVDCLGYLNAQVVLEVGTVSGTSPTLNVKIQDSADNSTFTDISGATFTQVTASNKSQTLVVNLQPQSRYIRAVATIAGTSPSFDMYVGVNLGEAAKKPVA